MVDRRRGLTMTIDELRTTLSGTVYTEADEGFPEVLWGTTARMRPTS
jgi:hypothetical protein